MVVGEICRAKGQDWILVKRVRKTVKGVVEEKVFLMFPKSGAFVEESMPFTHERAGRMESSKVSFEELTEEQKKKFEQMKRAKFVVRVN